MANELGEGLRARARRARTIAIKVRLEDWTTVTRARTLDAFTDSGDAIAQIALELLRAYAPPRPVRLLGVRVASFEDEARTPPPSRAARCSSRCRSDAARASTAPSRRVSALAQITVTSPAPSASFVAYVRS